MVLCTMIYAAVYSYVQPYKSWHTNILEAVLLVDLLLMLAVSSTAHFKVRNMQFDNVVNSNDVCT